MENPDVYMPGTAPNLPAAAAPTLPAVAPTYPTEAPAPADALSTNPFGEPQRPAQPQRGGLRGRISSAIAAIAAVVAKFFAAIKSLLLLLPKAKLLTTTGTALISVAAYALFWGFPFAAGFVLLLFVHEMGHVIQLRREGGKASAPMFVPFMGAFISARSFGGNALAEARVGLAGPVLGTLGSAVCLALAVATGSDMLRALAYIGFLLNLFNLLPMLPLDGGRAMAAMAPWMWFLGFGVMVALALLYPNPILLIILVLGGLETYRRWQARKGRSIEQAAYYRVPAKHRLMIGAVYIGLIALLALGMHESHILSSGGHSFRSL
jgi:Zn-dependent protease